MNLILTRNKFVGAGIFGELQDELARHVCFTLEHSYETDGKYAPKLQEGAYTCVRGQHQLHSMTEPFTTFEVTEVPGHSNILFHIGNYNRDSEGCVLLGMEIITGVAADSILSLSKKAFEHFMDLQKNVNEFTLTVKDLK